MVEVGIFFLLLLKLFVENFLKRILLIYVNCKMWIWFLVEKYYCFLYIYEIGRRLLIINVRYFLFIFFKLFYLVFFGLYNIFFLLIYLFNIINLVC